MSDNQQKKKSGKDTIKLGASQSDGEESISQTTELLSAETLASFWGSPEGAENKEKSKVRVVGLASLKGKK